MDLNPLTTPKTVLTDALNATVITFDGNEFVLQNDKGNCKVERARLPVGFIPVGIQEYGGIIYLAIYNPETGEGEVGSFPSPERDFNTSDFENLSPANFKTSQFIVNTGNPATKEKTAVLTKLVEPELLQLNPGDMFLVTYDIHDPTAASVEDEIDNKTKMDKYISTNPASRKLFKLKFYKVTDDNNLAEIKSEDVKLVDADDDLEGQYVYFKEKNQGTIAVGLELETIDQFDINVVDTSRRTDIQKSAVIEAIGFSNSLADFKGMQVQISSPTVENFYVDKVGSVKKVAAKLGDLAANAKVIGSVTPYSDYALYPKLRKDFNLELGKYASAGTGVNDIFRYYIDNNSAKVDFDFKFEGDNPNGLILYVEFYDPWSDYSVVKVIDNPTYYGVNSIQMELVEEPAITTFNSTTAGGTARVNLIPNPDVTIQKTLLNSTGLIRNSTALRRNHFYIVRISGVDIDYSTQVPTYKHFDFYKGMFTNKLLNDLYVKQNIITNTDPLYTPDFNTVDFKIEDIIKYSNKTTESIAIENKEATVVTDTGVVTNKPFYSIQESATTGGYYKGGNKYTRSNNMDIDLSVSGSENIFGNFKSPIIGIEFADVSSITPVITNEGFGGDANINPTTTASWTLTNINSLKYRLNKSMATSRFVYAPKVSEGTRAVKDRKNIPLANRFSKLANQSSTAASGTGTIQGAAFSLDARRMYINGSLVKNDCNVPSAAEIKNRIDTHLGATSKQAVLFGYIENISRENYNCRSGSFYYVVYRVEDGELYSPKLKGFGRRPDGYYPTSIEADKLNTLIAAVPFLHIHSAVDTIKNIYYANGDLASFDGSIKSIAKFNGLYYNVKYQPIANTKTYLSTYYAGASGTTMDFSTANINAYINSRKGTSEIIDNKLAINDGFIPYIEQPSTLKVDLNTAELAVEKSVDSALVTSLKAAKNAWNSDDIFNDSSTLIHGQVFSLDNPFYNSIANIFSGASTPGIPITEANSEIYIKSDSQTPGDWRGVRNDVTEVKVPITGMQRLNYSIDI